MGKVVGLGGEMLQLARSYYFMGADKFSLHKNVCPSIPLTQKQACLCSDDWVDSFCYSCIR